MLSSKAVNNRLYTSTFSHFFGTCAQFFVSYTSFVRRVLHSFNAVCVLKLSSVTRSLYTLSTVPTIATTNYKYTQYIGRSDK